MTTIKSFLNEHLELLFEIDKIFQAYWSKLTQQEQDQFWQIARSIDACANEEKNIVAGHVRASRSLARFMVRIQDIPFDYSRLPNDWLDFIHNQHEKEELLKTTERLLNSFISNENFSPGVLMYGNIKPDASLHRRMLSPKTSDQFRRRLLDTWDVVRFRMVAPDPTVARYAALRIWEEFFEKVVRCRNYYFKPKDDDHSDSYRSIHFELEPVEGRIVELQVLTKAREIVSILDHAPVFKKSIKLPSVEHEAWLFFFARKANLYDLQLAAIEQREPLGDGAAKPAKMFKHKFSRLRALMHK